MNSSIPDWLHWGRKIQAIAQIGMTYAENEWDRGRYQQLHDLAVEVFAAHTHLPAERVQAWFAAQPGYATPKVDVRGACFREGKVLLVREKSDGRWCLPGGWADVGDVPSEAARREVLEETGFECVVRKVIGVFDANRSGVPLSAYHAFKIIFLCDIIGGSAAPDHEITAVDFFARNALPELSMSRTGPHHLAECFEHHDDPARPTAFD